MSPLPALQSFTDLTVQMLKKKNFNLLLLPIVVAAGIILAIFAYHLLGLSGSNGGEERLPAAPPAPRENGFPLKNSRIADPAKNRSVEKTARKGGSTGKEKESAPYAGIRGKALDGKTGMPLNPFRAWICRDGEGNLREEARLKPGKVFRNQFGMFSFSGIDAGRYSLMIRCSGYKDLVVPGLIVPQKKEALELSLSRGTHIAGKVIDDRGTPVRNAMVLLRYIPANPDDPPPRRTSITTDRNGFYLFGDLPVGTYDIFLDSLTEPLDQRLGYFLAQDASLNVDFTMPSYNRIEFHITASTGTPLNSASIRLRSEKHRFNTKTNLRGRAMLNRVPPGNYNLIISKRNYRTLKEELSIAGTSGTQMVDRYLDPN